MNYSQRPRKKQRRSWLPLVGGVVLAVGGWLLWREGIDRFFVRRPAPVSIAPQPTPAPPVPASAAGGPQTGKARQPIFDRNMGTMAVSFKQASVYLRPVELQEGQKAVDHLAELLGLTAEKLAAEVRTERSFIWLKRNLSADIARKIAESHFNGVYLVDELQRYYPLHDHAAHVVGFVKDELGLAGAEFIYDTILSGDRTLAPQYLNLPGIAAADIPATGAAVVLSVDIDLQIILEKKLQLLLQQTVAKSASAVLLDAGSGEILAMAEVPAYDPNIYWKAAGTAHQNRILSEPVPMAGLNAFVKAAAELSSGNLPPELAAREEEAARVINPRIIKIVKGDVPVPTTPESQVWQPGIHLSPPFRWPLDFTQPDEKLAAFCARLGLNAKDSGLADSRPATGAEQQKKEAGCQLADDAWRLPALNLLAAFAQLTNGGQAIAPHLMRGIWRMDDAGFLPTSFPVSEGVGPKVSADFISFVEGLLPPGPGGDLILESIRSMRKEAVSEQARVREDEAPEATIEETLRFSTMTLGVGRRGEHQLAIIMMVDGARLNLSLPSPFRKAAAEVISQGHGLMAKRWGNEVKAPRLESDAALFQKWSQAQALDNQPPMIDSLLNLEMPDLVGMSLRKAMQALQGYNLKVGVQGSGQVTRQTPKAGVRLKGVTEAKLELQMMDAPKVRNDNKIKAN